MIVLYTIFAICAICAVLVGHSIFRGSEPMIFADFATPFTVICAAIIMTLTLGAMVAVTIFGERRRSRSVTKSQ